MGYIASETATPKDYFAFYSQFTLRMSSSATLTTFASVHDMIKTKDANVRQKIPVSDEEGLSMINFVESTKRYTATNNPEWDFTVETPLFQYIYQKDKPTGLIRNRSWTKIKGVPPQVLFHLLYDPVSRQSFDKYYVRFDVSRVVNEKLDVLVSEVEGPIGLSNREFVEWRWRHIPSGPDLPLTEAVYAIYLRSCPDDECCSEIRPKTKGVERAETWISGYVVKWWLDDNGSPVGSEVLVLSQVDSKGNVPKLLVNLVSGPSAPTKWSRSLVDAAEKLAQSKGISITVSSEEIDQKLWGPRGLNVFKSS